MKKKLKFYRNENWFYINKKDLIDQIKKIDKETIIELIEKAIKSEDELYVQREIVFLKIGSIDDFSFEISSKNPNN